MSNDQNHNTPSGETPQQFAQESAQQNADQPAGAACSTGGCCGLSKSLRSGWVLMGVAVALVAGLLLFNTGAAPTPQVFDETRTLDAAVSASSESGRPVLVLATADWCPPCQMLKKSTLADPTVTAWIDENTETVYLTEGDHRDAIERLKIQAYPTTIIMRDGVEAARFEGYAETDEYLTFLRTASGA